MNTKKPAKERRYEYLCGDHSDPLLRDRLTKEVRRQSACEDDATTSNIDGLTKPRQDAVTKRILRRIRKMCHPIDTNELILLAADVVIATDNLGGSCHQERVISQLVDAAVALQLKKRKAT
jgi:hypothetical protein